MDVQGLSAEPGIHKNCSSSEEPRKRKHSRNSYPEVCVTVDHHGPLNKLIRTFEEVVPRHHPSIVNQDGNLADFLAHPLRCGVDIFPFAHITGVGVNLQIARGHNFLFSISSDCRTHTREERKKVTSQSEGHRGNPTRPPRGRGRPHVPTPPPRIHGQGRAGSPGCSGSSRSQPSGTAPRGKGPGRAPYAGVSSDREAAGARRRYLGGRAARRAGGTRDAPCPPSPRCSAR